MSMMRFLTPPFLNELWRQCLPLAPIVAKRQGTRLLTFTSALSNHHPATLTRPLFTGRSLRKDVPEPNTDQPEEKLDLDIWKSVMRSQVPVEEEEKKKQGDTEEGADPGDPGGAGQEGSSSLLDATRELVVMWRLAGKVVPEQMTDEEVQTLTELTTKASKKKFLKYLAIKENHKKSRKGKQEKKKLYIASQKEEKTNRPGRSDGEEAQEGEEDAEEEGKILKNSFLLQFWGRSLDKLLGWKSVQAMLFGQPLVFDMSYEQHMSRREVDNTVSQLMEVEGWNRRAKDPFHLHFCNLQPDGAYQREFLKRYGSEAWERLLITSTEQRHVDMFPPEQLVYLSADSPNVLRAIDPSKVYIIGSLVDRSNQPGVSLANAKRLKLATARLPLDEFLHWEVGGKNLTLDQMVRILLMVKETGKWEEALEFVPKRKHDGFHQQQGREPPARMSRAFSRNGTDKDRGFNITGAFNSEGTDRDRVRVTDSSEGTGTDRGFNDRARVYNSDRTFRSGGGDGELRYGDRRMKTANKENELRGGVKERDRGFTSRDRDRVAVSREAGSTRDGENNQQQGLNRLRISLKNKMEERNNKGNMERYGKGKRQKNWWEE